MWLIERLEGAFPTLEAVLDGLNIRAGRRRGQGYIVGNESKPTPSWFRRLADLTPDRYTPLRIDPIKLGDSPPQRVERFRVPSIYDAPLLLCPKGRFLSGDVVGRYTAATSEVPVAYTQNFYGISFAETDALHLAVLSGILNSAMTTFQFAFGSGAIGIERPAVSPQDILAIRVPDLTRVKRERLDAIAARLNELVRGPTRSGYGTLDEAVFDLFRLETEERTIVRESVERARWMLVDTRQEFERAARQPSRADYRAYAKALVRSVDAYLRAAGRRHLEAIVFALEPPRAATTELAAVRLRMRPGAPADEPAIADASRDEQTHLMRAFADLARGDSLPYLNERRSLRVYSRDELLVLKPAEWRYWTQTAGLNDADAILADHWSRQAA
jgi:hypothetical protein